MAVLQIKMNDFKGNSSLIKRNISLSSIECENELNQDMDTEWEILMWKIMMIMKFMFSH